MSAHTIAHALYPVRCACAQREIVACVICGRTLTYPRQHVDTCGARCFRKLIALQQRRDAATPRCQVCGAAEDECPGHSETAESRDAEDRRTNPPEVRADQLGPEGGEP